MIELGQKVRDVVTGFTGIAVAKIEYLNGCLQIMVRPKMVAPKKGDQQVRPEGAYIDIEQLVVVERKKIVIERRESKLPPPSGGIRQHPE